MRDRRGWIAPVAVGMFALAIGLVLGSGPLRTALIGSLGVQVDSLEDQVAEAELAADQANVTNDYGDEWVDATAPQLLGTTLAGRTVAFVSVDDADAEAVAGAQAHVVQAGGTVAASVTVESLWTDPNQSAFRAALAPQLASSISGLDGTETVDQVFSQALAQALLPGTADPAAESAGSGDEADANAADPIGPNEEDRGAVLWALLTDAELVSGTRTGPADAIVMVAGEAPSDAGESSLQVTANLTLIGVFAGYDAPIVAANGPDADDDLVASVLADAAVLAPRVSTVTWIDTTYSQVTVALALREQFDGWVGHYGPGEGREAAPPPIEP
ncbi:copper transporter [Demequina aurantiaca]|uniref:copper transporter n=1 Tax=Demequina aurantiaca TaxID=676200 RepID=UPI003D34BD80